jgi:hypothetical protein
LKTSSHRTTPWPGSRRSVGRFTPAATGAGGASLERSQLRRIDAFETTPACSAALEMIGVEQHAGVLAARAVDQLAQPLDAVDDVVLGVAQRSLRRSA